MSDDFLTFDELRRVQSKERNKDTLQALDQDFFDRARNYLEVKQETGSYVENKEYRNAKNILEDIIDRRQKKIVKLAFLSIKSDVSIENLLPIEEDLFEEVKQVIGSHRHDIREELFEDGGDMTTAIGADDTDMLDRTDTGTTEEQPADAAESVEEETAAVAAETTATAESAEPDTGEDTAETEDMGGTDPAGDDAEPLTDEDSGEPDDTARSDGADEIDNDPNDDSTVRSEDDTADEDSTDDTAIDADETDEDADETIFDGDDGSDTDDTEHTIFDGDADAAEEADEADAADETAADEAADTVEDADATEETEEDAPVEVTFAEHVPEFMGVDLQAYGPFDEGESAEIPAKNAEVLAEQGKLVEE